MLMAAFGDTRGNLEALRAVLEEVEREGIQTVVNTGDSVVGAPFPNEVIDLVQRHGVPSVQGERDRLVVRFLRKKDSLRRSLGDSEFEAVEEAYAKMTSPHLEYLKGLPQALRLEIDGIEVALCHGGLTSQSERLSVDDSEERFQRQREIAPVDVVVCGHGGQSFVREVSGTLFVNPGSVGMSEDGMAHYAVIRAEEEKLEADLRRVEYSLSDDLG